MSIRRDGRITGIFGIIVLFAALCFGVLFFPVLTEAAPTDQIRNYEITIDIEEDATVNLTYHIEWEVLESEKLGPLTWVKIGIPNRNYLEYKSLSDTIQTMKYSGDGGSFMEVHFNEEYKKGEIASFDFSIHMDYMYQVDKFQEGYTVYDFTPGWFDDIAIDNLTIRWKGEKAESVQPSCLMEDEYYIWNKTLKPGEKMTVSVTYSNDAFAFDLTKKLEEDSAYNGNKYEVLYILLGILVCLVLVLGPIVYVVFLICNTFHFVQFRGFGKSYDKKITRTKIVYWQNCPGCGSVHKEGKDECEYCGRSMIKSKEIIEEKDVKEEDKEILKHTRKGTYRYSTLPDTFVQVQVTKVPRPVPVTAVARKTSSSRTTSGSTGSSSSGSSRSSGSRSSCVHSSCACACACACAGGGRAGCSVKDFYKTDLKLRYFANDVTDLRR